MKTKICTKCHIEKPISEFHKEKNGRFGVRGNCKQCARIKSEKTIKKEKLFKMGRKICTKCGKEKELKEFYKNEKSKDKLKATCKMCDSLDHEKYRKENKVHLNVVSRQFYYDNKEKMKQQAKLLRLNNLELYKEKNKRQHEKRKEVNHILNKIWRNNNKERTRIRLNNRYKNDIDFKIRMKLRTRLTRALQGNSKSKSTLKLLGCTIEELKIHLESKFTKGMSWDNCGLNGWEIDHIKPCASFDLSKPKEQLKCFNYTNLQPLWAEDNLKKSDKLDYVSESN